MPMPQHASSVLVVDDDVVIRDTLREVLEQEGYEVVSAENGKEALEVLARSEPLPGVMLLDLMMPVMTGWEVLEVLQKSERLSTLPVVVVSAMGAPCTLFLQKPVKLSRLLEVVSRYCGCPVETRSTRRHLPGLRTEALGRRWRGAARRSASIESRTRSREPRLPR